MPNNASYTSNAKTWWQQNSDRLGSDLNWDTFSEVWEVAPAESGSHAAQ